ncbi:hypothetical protein PMIN04_002435 [Paraphaeosphaeria minitans]
MSICSGQETADEKRVVAAPQDFQFSARQIRCHAKPDPSSIPASVTPNASASASLSRRQHALREVAEPISVRAHGGRG